MKTQNANSTQTAKLTPKKALILLLPVVFALVAALSVALLVQGGLKPAEDPTPPPPAESSTEPKDAEVMVPVESEADEPYSRGLEFRINSDGSAAVVGIGSCTDRALTVPGTTPTGEIVTAIGSNAFLGIAAIGEVILPESIMTIGKDAFRGSGIHSVSIGGAVVSIGEGAFADCPSLTAINVSEANAMYASDDGVLFNREMTEIICYPSGKPNRRYTISSSVTRIAPSAFSSCANLREIAFEGTEKQWKEVYVCSGNSSLHEADMFFAPDEK